MSSSPFASLHAGMLVRKGGAAPSVTPSLAPSAAANAHAPVGEPVAREPVVRETVVHGPAARTPARAAPEPRRASPARPQPAPAMKPPAAKPQQRASVRLSHEQARALKLAALVLDLPQQELLADGLETHLEKLACGPLASCACFRKIAALRDQD